MEKAEQTAQIYEFGPYRIDVRRRVLLRAGEPVAGMTPKLVETLAALVARSGEIVGKNELMSAVWPDAFVEESNLSSNISHLRKALGADAAGRAYIETFPKRGYRFTAEVRACAAQSSTQVAAAPPVEATAGAADAVIIARRTRAHIVTHTESDDGAAGSVRRVMPPAVRRRASLVLLAAGLACVVCGAWALRLWPTQRARVPASAAEVKTLAILPFKELGAGETGQMTEDDHLGLGMADALITKFGNTRRIVARPTSAVRKYAQAESDPVAAGRELNVEAVLTGNIQRAGERLRVTVQLLRVADGVPLWGETFNDQYTDIFAVQDSISERVAAALAPQLSGAEQAGLKKRYTENIEAYRLYLLGVNEWNKFTPDGAQKSVAYYHQAIALDPTYALAYAGLANAYGLTGRNGGLAAHEGKQKARWAAERAIALDDTLAEAHYALASVNLFDDWDWAAAERESARAIALNPNSADFHALRAGYFEVFGRFDDALAELRAAQRLNPLSPFICMETAQTYYLARRPDEALAESRQLLALDPHFYLSHYSLGRALELKGQPDEAIAAYQQWIDMFGRDPLTLSSLGHAYALAGRRAEAQAALAELQAMQGRRYVLPYWLALIYAGLDDKAHALDQLERAADDHYFMLIWLRHEPRFDGLHDDPRFTAVLQRTGLQ